MLLSATPLQWEPLDEPGAGGRMDAIHVSPHDARRVLLGGDMLGIGRSTDGGDAWMPTSGLLSWEVGDFTSHPDRPNEVWAGTLSGPHRSIDGGQTWEPRRAGMPAPRFGEFTAPVETILYDLGSTARSRLLAFTGDHRDFSGNTTNQGRVYLSRNGGESWTLASTVVDGGNIVDAAYAGGSHEYLWTAVRDHGIYLSSNDGKAGTWTRRSSGLPTLGSGVHLSGVVAHPDRLGTAFATVAVDQGDQRLRTDPARADAGGVYRTTDRGRSWQKVEGGGSSSYWPSSFQHLDIGRDGATLYAVNDSWSSPRGVYKSADGGSGWQHVLSAANASGRMSEATPFGPGDTVDQWWVEIDPNDDDRVYTAGTHSALRSTDGGATWDDVTSDSAGGGLFRGTGYGGWVATNAQWNPYRPSVLVAQGLDSGHAMIADGDGSAWRVRQSGLPSYGGGQDVAFGGDGQTLFVGLGQQGFSERQVARSLDGGVSWSDLSVPAAVENAMVGSIHADPSDGNAVWAVMGGSLYRSDNALADPASVAWTRLDRFNGETVRDIEAAPNTGDDFFVATDGGVWKTTNGRDFAALGGPAGGEASALAVDPTDPAVVWAAVNNSFWGDFGVWRLDSGSGGGWQRMFTGDRGAAAWVRDLAVDPSDPQRVALVTNQNPFSGVSLATGVWLTEDGGQSWSQQNEGLRVLRGSTINFSPAGDRIAVGLNGGGFATASLPPATPQSFIGRSIRIQALNDGEYVTRTGGGAGPLQSTAASAGDAEVFEVVDAGDGFVALRASNGKYVAADLSNGRNGTLYADRTSVRGWEKFELVPSGPGRFGLLANANNRLVASESDGNQPLKARTDPGSLGAWEAFTLEIV
ncbi:hypothetical protein PSMK_00220 [Phycisphaera mikurensis NBRC 102666]|uniref:Sortilin N-terminal domain-containing protein n=1 Tax=Phycisphaera mikurensis (strain NBRC 102666 / KCTC 22515 / FYK2301M01) TaxID=1142394 RepID=I0IA93_PHYMF|nr:hypothetical protein PSMK_00220 [Phycisphaera mikurensis NBRC 102666]